MKAVFVLSIAGALCVLATAPSLAQGSASASAARVASDVQSWVGELEELHGRLEAIQRQALRDADLGAAQTELGERIKAAMERADPGLGRGLARMRAMESEAAAARQRGDTPRLQQLGAEADQIQRQFASVQERVLQQPDIASQVAGFQASLERRMAELDPATPRLVARFRDLESRLAEAAQR